MTSDAAPTVGGLVSALDRAFPAQWAEDWDRVGLVVGGAGAAVTGVLVTLDATAESVERAAEMGANVLVTHHPPFLECPEHAERVGGPAGTPEAALRLGIAVISAHTNLDRAPSGGDALPKALGLSILEPLECGTEDVVLVVTYVPKDAVDRVVAAMAATGAGRLGDYTDCAFISDGSGRFTPLAGARPVTSAGREGAPESRIEMVAPSACAEAVLDSARDAHPYEEPVIVAVPGVRPRGAARLGRICTWRESATVSELAAHVSDSLGVRCRVWGDGSKLAGRVAVANGSASSLIGDAVAKADTLVAGEVRYHDALAAAAAGLAVIEAGHDATEWPLVAVLSEAVRSSVREHVEVTVESPKTGWWTVEGSDVRG
ncbi:MAG: Nif3-like dinuclear metal center hexameric protein [Actinobacteria bacterium]|nr:Nif3-like dinuclear metal center hexameric protein [Actinomycetota bacterium]